MLQLMSFAFSGLQEGHHYTKLDNSTTKFLIKDIITVGGQLIPFDHSIVYINYQCCEAGA
jgi:hypothetical protein